MTSSSLRDARPARASAHAVGGFTLIELMVVVALIALLSLVAAPSMQKVFKSNRVQTEAASFVGDLMLARTEAVRRGQSVSACVSSDGATCLGANTWQSGWILFSDSAAACAGPASPDVPIRVRKAFNGTDTMVASLASTSCVTFNREGFTNNLGTATVTFTLHTADNLQAATRCVAVDLGGRLTIQTAGQAATACS